MWNHVNVIGAEEMESEITWEPMRLFSTKKWEKSHLKEK